MTERAFVFESGQIGVESPPGTAVAALKRLLCTGITFTPTIPVEPFRPFGSKAPTTAIARKESAEGSIEGVLAYNDIVYLLSGLLGPATIATPGGGTDVRRWTFLPKQFSADNPKTFTIEKGSRYGAERLVYALINALSMHISEEEATITGTIIGRGVTDDIQLSTNEQQTITIDAESGTFTITFGGQTTGALAWNAAASEVQTALEGLSTIGTGNIVVTKAEMVYTLEFRNDLGQQEVAEVTTDATLLIKGAGVGTATVATTVPGITPTSLAELPVSPKAVSIYVAATEAGLGAAKLTRCLDLTFGVSDRFSPLTTIDAAESSWVAAAEKAPTFEGGLVVEHNSVAAAMVENLRNTDTRFMQILCSEGEIEEGFPYRIEVTFPFKFLSDERGDQNDVYGSTFGFTPIYDSAFGGWLRVVVDNGLTAL